MDHCSSLPPSCESRANLQARTGQGIGPVATAIGTSHTQRAQVLRPSGEDLHLPLRSDQDPHTVALHEDGDRPTGRLPEDVENEVEDLGEDGRCIVLNHQGWEYGKRI